MTISNAEGGWPKTMRAWTFNGGGGGLDKALFLEEAAAPPPRSLLTPTAVLVQVLYMSVNPADYKLAGLGLLARPMLSPPAHPGMDYAGRVVLAGDKVEGGYRPGQLVFGRVEPNKYGTLAEYIVVRSAEGLARVPDELEGRMPELAAVGTCGLTALQTIQPYVSSSSHEGGSGDGPTTNKVFINGGSGGTGTFGIQIAKALGCHVTASCSAANAELCKSLGADEVIDYTTQDVGAALAAQGLTFRLVVDNVGYTPAGQEDLHAAANKFLQEDGTFVQVGGGASKDQIKAVAKRALLPAILGGGKRKWKMAMTAQSHEGLATIAEWIRTGAVKILLDEDSPIPFENAPKAYEKLMKGRTKGKIVVKVS